jgi:outer membrane protein OmpA-like peptidoglycan-associated protein
VLRFGKAAAWLLLILSLMSVRVRAQNLGPDDPVPPGAKAVVLPLSGKALDLRATTLDLRRTVLDLRRTALDLRRTVLDLRRTALDLRPTILELRGLATGLVAQAQPLEAALKDLGATVKGRDIKINLSADVLFDFDKASLRPEAGPALAKVAEVLKAYPKATALIEGHTDGKGNAGYNQKLSEQRAASVRKWLLDYGVATPMTTRGYGKTRPIAPNVKPNGADDPLGRQKNRRVEITVKT